MLNKTATRVPFFFSKAHDRVSFGRYAVAGAVSVMRSEMQFLPRDAAIRSRARLCHSVSSVRLSVRPSVCQ